MRCIICDSQELKVLDSEDKYYFCSNCKAIFIERKRIVEAETEKKRYEGHDNTHQNEGYVKMLELFLEKSVFPFIANTDNVLEFGCGPGPVLASLLEREDYQVDKYDPYFYPEKVFENKKYDLITSTEVFEHFSDPRQEMELLTSHLKDGGYLAIMTSFHPGLEEFADWWYKWDPTHIVFYNLNTFQKLAKDYNLKIIYTNGEKYILFKKNNLNCK